MSRKIKLNYTKRDDLTPRLKAAKENYLLQSHTLILVNLLSRLIFIRNTALRRARTC